VVLVSSPYTGPRSRISLRIFATQRFRLSHGVMKLSHVWLKGLDVVALARSIVEGLRDLTGETSALFKLQEDRGICILECESRHVLSISRGVGDNLSLTKGSTGKAMLGFMETQRQSEICRQSQREHNVRGSKMKSN
jgi:IclR family transcriptional regulator, acetate operon repressor